MHLAFDRWLKGSPQLVGFSAITHLECADGRVESSSFHWSGHLFEFSTVHLHSAHSCSPVMQYASCEAKDLFKGLSTSVTAWLLLVRLVQQIPDLLLQKSVKGNIVQFLPQAKASTQTKHFLPILQSANCPEYARTRPQIVRKFLSAGRTKKRVVWWFFLAVCVPLPCALSSFSALAYDPFAQLLQKLPIAMSSVRKYLDVGCLIARHLSEELVTWGTNKAQVSAAEPVHTHSSLRKCRKRSAWSLSHYVPSVPLSQTSGSRIAPFPVPLPFWDPPWRSHDGEFAVKDIDSADVQHVFFPQSTRSFPKFELATTVGINGFYQLLRTHDRY